jgi:hypothetical protein
VFAPRSALFEKAIPKRLLVVRQCGVDADGLFAEQREPVVKNQIVRSSVGRKIDIDIADCHLAAVVVTPRSVSVLPVHKVILWKQNNVNVVSNSSAGSEVSLQMHVHRTRRHVHFEGVIANRFDGHGRIVHQRRVLLFPKLLNRTRSALVRKD